MSRPGLHAHRQGTIGNGRRNVLDPRVLGLDRNRVDASRSSEACVASGDVAGGVVATGELE